MKNEMSNEEPPWVFAQKFVPEFYRNMGRFPTDAEMEEAEQGWIEYLSNQGEEILDETAKTFYRFNERGEVIDAMLVEPFESD